MTTPKGPKGEKRPADVIGNAVRAMWLATGQTEETNHSATDPRRASSSILPDIVFGRHSGRSTP